MKTEPFNADSAQEIAELSDLANSDLVERWIELHGTTPPKRLTKDLLVRGIAHDMQVRQIGGLGPVEKKALIALAEGRACPVPTTLKAGTRLYRTWQDITQEVLVLESGYGWRGKTYTSLSEVARAITGTRWSGPRFFGIKA